MGLFGSIISAATSAYKNSKKSKGNSSSGSSSSSSSGGSSSSSKSYQNPQDKYANVYKDKEGIERYEGTNNRVDGVMGSIKEGTVYGGTPDPNSTKGSGYTYANYTPSANNQYNYSPDAGGRYDMNTDYAALIEKEQNETLRNQYIAERQNKINAMQMNGAWNNSDNNIQKQGSVSPFRNNLQYDQNKDYAALITKEQNPALRSQYITERQNKMNSMQQNGSWSNGDIYKQEPKSFGGGNSLFPTLSKGKPTANQEVFDIIQEMKNRSNQWGAADPTQRAQLAAINELYADRLRAKGVNVTKGADGKWRYDDGNELYSTLYERKEAPMIDFSAPDINPFGMEYMEKEELYDEMGKTAKLQEEARRAQIAQAVNNLNLQKQGMDTNFDDIAKQAYIAKRKAAMSMPQELAAMGVSGGAAESTNLGLETNYENNLNSNEVERQKMLAEIQNNIINAKLSGDSDIAGYQAQANQAALQAYLAQSGQKNNDKQWLAGFLAQRDDTQYNRDWGEKEFAYQTAQDAYAKTQAEKENAMKWALQTGDYNALKKYGIDTTYLTEQQAYDRVMQELQRQQAQASLQNTYATIQKKNSSVSGSGRKSSARKTSGGNTKKQGDSPVITPQSTPKVNSDSVEMIRRWYSSIPKKEDLYKMVKNAIIGGTITEADYEAFTKSLKK